MSSVKSYLFNGQVTAVQPLQVTYKDSVFGTDQKIRRLPRNGPMREDVGAYLPGTSYRGALRHCMHAVVLRAAKQLYDEKIPFALNHHFMIAQGVDITGEVENEESDGIIDFGRELREINPALSLGGRWKLSAHATVGSMMPTTQDCIALYGGGARGLMFERNDLLLNELTDLDVEKLTRLLNEQSTASVETKQIKQKIAELKKALRTAEPNETEDIKKQLAELEQKKGQVREDRVESKDSIRYPLESYEAFAAGTQFTHRMRLKHSSEIELGLWLATIREFARLPLLGGKHAVGCGDIYSTWDVSTWHEDSNTPISIGKVWFEDHGFYLEGQELESALARWTEARSQVGAVDYRRYLA